MHTDRLMIYKQACIHTYKWSWQLGFRFVPPSLVVRAFADVCCQGEAILSKALLGRPPKRGRLSGEYCVGYAVRCYLIPVLTRNASVRVLYSGSPLLYIHVQCHACVVFLHIIGVFG